MPVPNLTKSLLAEWSQIPTDAKKKVVEGLPGIVEAIVALLWH